MLIKIICFLSFLYYNNVSYYFYYVLEIIFIFVIKNMQGIEELENSIRTNNKVRVKEIFIGFFLILVEHFMLLLIYSILINFIINL